MVSLHPLPGSTGSATTFDLTPTAAAGKGAVNADSQGFSVESADFAHGFLTKPLLAHYLNTLGQHGVIRIGGYSMDLVWPAFGKYADSTAPPQAIGGTVDQADLDALKQLLDATGWHVTLGLPLKSVIDPAQVRNPSKDPSPPVTLDQAVAEAVAAYSTLGSSLLGIEVGNEFDNVTTLSAGQYYDQLRRYQDAIRAALPTAHIRMIGPSANTSATNTQLDGFVEAAAGDGSTTPADTLEELSSHYYPTSHCGSSTASISALMSDATYTKARAKLQGMVAAGNRLSGGVPSVLNETNSAACSGQPGVSDAYASALWSLDWLLQASQAGASRVQFHTNTAAICGDFQPRDSANYPISYRYYGAFCAKDQADLDAQRLTPAPLYYGLWAFRQVPVGRFVDLGIDDSYLSQLRAYGVESADGNLTVVLINVQDPADAASTDDAVTLHLPSGYSGMAQSVALQDTADGGLAATDPSGITLGGRTVEPGGAASGTPRHTPVVVKDAASTITVAPGTAQIVSYPDVRLPGAVEVTGLSVAGQPLVGQQPNTVMVSVANTTDTAQNVTATVQVPDGWRSETATQQIPAGGQADIPVAVTPALAPGTATLEAVASAPGVRQSGTASVGVITAPPGDAVPLALDGGDADSPVYDGYGRLSPDDAWDASKGYGWVATPPSSRDRLAPDALRRDFVLSKTAATLRLAVPPGQHDVWVLRGDSGYSSGDTVISEGGTVLADPGGTLSAGQFQWFRFALDGGASGRTADLAITGIGGNYWRMNALVMLP